MSGGWLESEVYPAQRRTPFRGLIRAAVRAEQVMGRRAMAVGGPDAHSRMLLAMAAGLRFGQLTEAALRRIRAAAWETGLAVDVAEIGRSSISGERSSGAQP